MEYCFVSDVKAKDLWHIAMVRTYRSFLGIINVVFTVAMILLAVRFWSTSNDIVRCLLILACLIFPVIQPLAIYGRSAKQLEGLPDRVELVFNDSGVHVTSGDEKQDIKWNKIVNAIKQPNMIIVMSDNSHGYMLTNRVLGDEKEQFYEYLCAKIRKQTK